MPSELLDQIQSPTTLELNPVFFESSEDDNETAAIYRREAKALYKNSPERAAIMLLNAAYANERDDRPDERILRDLSMATQLQPDQAWVLSTVRRFILKMDCWKQAIALIERELRLTKDIPFSTALCLEAASICWIVADDPNAAINWVKRALEFNPQHTGALYTAISLYYETGSMAEAAVCCQNIAPLVSSPTERAVILSNAANIQRHLNNHVQALHLLERALQADPTLIQGQIMFAILKAEQNEPLNSAQACEHISGLLQNPTLKSGFLKHSAQLLIHAPEPDIEKATHQLENTLQLTPDDIAARTLLIDMYRDSEAWQRSVDAIQKLIDMLQDPGLKAAYYMQCGNIYLDELSQPQNALHAFAMAWQLDPKLHIAFNRMRAILESDELWDELQSHYKTVLENKTESGETNALLYLAAEAARMGGNMPIATQILLECTELAAAFWPLQYLLENLNSWEQLAILIEQYIKIAKDPKTIAALSLKLSNIYAYCLNSRPQALTVLKSAYSYEETRGLALAYLQQLREMQQYETLVTALLKEAQKTLDENDQIAWMLEAACISDRQLKNPSRALQILQDILRRHPKELTTIETMRDIAWKAADWDCLIKANNARNEVLTDEENVTQTLCESAFAYEKLGKYDDACILYASSSKIRPLSPFATLHYTDILKKMALNEKRYAVFANMAEHSSGEPGLFAMQMAADIAAFQLRKHEAAIPHYHNRFEQTHDLSNLLSLVFERILNRQRSETQAELLTALKAYCDDEETRALLQWGIAQTQSYTLETANALVLFQQCFRQKFGTYLRAEIMQRIRAVPDANTAAWLETYAELVQDKNIAIEMLREASLRYLWVEDDFDSAQRTATAAFATNREDLRTLWELERFAAITEDWNALAQIREKLSKLENSPTARVQTLASAIIPYLDANLPQHAVRISNECLKFDAHCFPALLTLALIAEDSKNWVELAKIVDRLTEASNNEHNRYGYGLWGAKIWDKYVNNKTQALASLELILTQNPASLPAIACAETLLIQIGDNNQLSRLYSRAINALPKGDEQVSLLKKHASLLARQLQNVPAATTELGKVLAQQPDDLDALSAQAGYLCELACWSDAIVVLEHWGRITDNSEEKQKINIQQATILVKRLSQLGQAKRLLSKHLNIFPQDVQAFRLLFDIAIAENNWQDAKTQLEEIENDKNEDNVIWACIEFTKIARKANWDDNTRVHYEKIAIKAVLRHRGFFDALCEDYVKFREIPRLIASGKALMAQTQEPSLIAEYQGCIAAFMVANQQYKEALAFLSSVIKEDYNTDWAFLARAQALYRAGQYQSSASEFRRTLRMNMSLHDAFPTFIEVLRVLNNKISQSAVTSLYHHLTGKNTGKAELRCIHGTPRGFLDIGVLPIPAKLTEAERYLRIMAPHIYRIYQEHEANEQSLPPMHPAAQRCRLLFGQMVDVKEFYTAPARKDASPIRVRIDSPLALIIDESIIGDEGPRFDFWAAYAMHQAISGGCLINIIDNDEISALFAALCQVKPEEERAQALKKWLWKLIPRADRKPFKDGVPFQNPDWDKLRLFLNDRAACVGSVFSASPDAALHAIPNSKALQHFLISEDYERFIKLYWSEQF